MATRDPVLGPRYTRLAQLAKYSDNLLERAAAFLQVQNFTRRWINDVILPAKDLGYDAVVCAEIDSEREGGARACVNLYVFSADKLTPPEWLSGQ